MTLLALSQREFREAYMSDVLQIAMKYRSRLAAEVAKVDDFLRMAEEFSKERDPEERVKFFKTAATAKPAEQPATDRPRTSGNGAAAT